MQRSITNKNYLVSSVYVILFVIYSALSGIYQFLPHFLAVMFVFFSIALKKNDSLSISLILICLLIFEAENGYVLFSVVLYFLIVYRYIMPNIIKNISCISCTRGLMVIFVYLGFFIFHYILSTIFLLPLPGLNYYVVYYIFIDFFIVSII